MIIVCILSGLVLLGVGVWLLAQTRRLELSRRAAWGWCAVCGAGWALSRPLAGATAGDVLLSVLLAVLALLLLTWGRDPRAPECVRHVTGWGDLHAFEHTNTPS